MNIEFFKKHGDKLLFALAIAIIVAGLLRLWGGRATGNPAISEEETPSLFITQWWESDPERETLTRLIEEYENLHGKIKIILNTASYEDLRTDLFDPAILQSDKTSLGDVIALDPLWVPELQKRGAIESAHAPIISFINVLYYNMELLREAGFSRPPKTRNEFLSYARVLAGINRQNSKGNQVLALGLNSSRGIYDDIFPWIWAAGAQLVREGEPVINSRQVTDTFSFFAALNSEGFITPGSFSADSGKKLENFVSGKTAFIIAPASYIRYIKEGLGDDTFGVTSVPSPDNYAGKHFYGVAGWTAGLNSGSAQKEEARHFLDFLAEKESFLSNELWAIPGSGIPPAQDSFYSRVWDIAIAGESASDFSGLPWTELEETFKEELSTLFSGKSSPAETAAAIQGKWSLILKR